MVYCTLTTGISNLRNSALGAHYGPCGFYVFLELIYWKIMQVIIHLAALTIQCAGFCSASLGCCRHCFKTVKLAFVKCQADVRKRREMALQSAASR